MNNIQPFTPLVSLVVPCYNVAPWIDRLFSSIQAQTFTQFEVIAVDDGSVDATAEHLFRWVEQDRRIRVVSQTNRGPHQARLAGINCARAEWVAFADADDELLFDHLEALWTGRGDNVVVVVTGIVTMDIAGRIKKSPK